PRRVHASRAGRAGVRGAGQGAAHPARAAGPDARCGRRGPAVQPAHSGPRTVRRRGKPGGRRGAGAWNPDAARLFRSPRSRIARGAAVGTTRTLVFMPVLTSI